MIVYVLVAIAIVFIVTAFLAPRFKHPSRPATTIAELPDDEPIVPTGFTLVSDTDLAKMRSEVSALNRIIGENEAAHRALLAQVQQECLVQMQQFRAELELEFAKKKQANARDTTARSRASLVAKIGEHFAPLLEGFPYNFKDARHVGEIFDFLVYDGLEDGEIREIVFLEVKTKRSGARITNPREKMLRDAIAAGRVRYDVFVPDTGGAKIGKVEV